MRITIDIPNITEASTAGKLNEVIEYLNILAEDLNDMLANIDTDNLSNHLLGQIGRSESIDTSGFASVGLVQDLEKELNNVKAVANSALTSASSAYAKAENAQILIGAVNSAVQSMSGSINDLYTKYYELEQKVNSMGSTTT